MMPVSRKYSRFRLDKPFVQNDSGHSTAPCIKTVTPIN